MAAMQIISIVVFVAVMVLVVTEKIPRALAALLGAVVLFCAGVVDFNTGVGSIDFNTLGVLCGMMMFVAIVRQSGLFEYVAIAAVKICKGKPWRIMAAFVLVTAIFSAFLDNVTTILLVGPMTIMLCRMLEIDATPFLIAEIFASNIGGTATLIGDPPNIMIGSAANLTFLDFIIYDSPVIIIILLILIPIFSALFCRRLYVSEECMQKVMAVSGPDVILDKPLFKKSLVMIALTIVAFMLHGMLHLEPSIIALAAAGIMVLISKRDFEIALQGIEWSTIGFFLGIFIIVGAMVHTGIISMLSQGLVSVSGGNVVVLMLVLLWGSALFSSVLDNIPFVATMVPIIAVMQSTGIDVSPLWWAISLGACLGGNGTLVGASANVVLSGISRKEGYPITFMRFTKVAFPLMILTIAVATVYLLIIF